MAGTKRSEAARQSEPQKAGLSTDCTLQLECMKLESLVIAYQHDAVNTFPGLVHTARHLYTPPVTPSESEVPEVASPTARGTVPKVRLVRGVKS